MLLSPIARAAGVALALAALLAPLPAHDPTGPGRPNVLIVLADDLGFADLGCYGSEIATPNLDALAADGVRFTQFYNTGRCWPTRGALMAGYYAQQIRRDKLEGVEPSGGRGRRPEWAPLLAARLGGAGYRCYHSGKWHIDGEPLANGFEHSYVLNDHDRYFNPKNHAEDGERLPAVPKGGEHYVTSAIADHAIRCLAEHAKEHGEEPFFQFVAFTSPHFPLHAPADDIARYGERYVAGWAAVREARHARQSELGLLPDVVLSAVERDVGPPYDFPEALKKLGPNEVNRPLPWDELTASQQRFQADKMAIHAAMVDRMDREVGRIVAQLRAMDALQDTLILFLSDNGASAEIMVRGDGHDPEAARGSAESYLCLGPGWSSAANTPFRRHKTWVHEGGISTPLIAHWPARIDDAGGLRRTPGHVVDIVPTVLELAGAEPVAGLPGRSLVPALTDDEAVERDSLWWSHEGHRALRQGDWKLVAARGDAWSLYDLASDRSETNDLSTEEPERVAAMAAEWQRQENAFRKRLLGGD